MRIIGIWHKIKYFIMNSTKDVSVEVKPDGTTKISVSVFPQENLKVLEKMLQDFASRHQKSIGSLTPNETFHGLVAASVHFFITHPNKSLATKYAEEALNIEGNNNILRIWLATIYGNFFNNDIQAKQKAIDHCIKVLKIEPNNWQAKFCQAIYTSHIEEIFTESIPLYLEVKKLMEGQGIVGSVDYGNLHQFLGVQYSKPSNYRDVNKAEVLLRQSIAILQKIADKDNSAAKFWLDNAKKELKKLTEKLS